MKTYRAWINQPSTLQPLHRLNGTRCIVQDTGERSVQVWFTEGDVHSMQVLRECLSKCQLSSAG
jgi:hypothetical protein